MALIQCPECGKEISDQAKQCIHCGYPIKTSNINDNKEELYVINVASVGEHEEDVAKIVQEIMQLESEKAMALVKCGQFQFDDLTYTQFKTVVHSLIQAGALIDQDNSGKKKEVYLFTTCPICNQQVSKTAPTCPHCGHVLKEQPQPDSNEKSGLGFWGVFGAVVLAILILSFL